LLSFPHLGGEKIDLGGKMKVKFRIRREGHEMIMCRVRGTGLDVEFKTEIEIHSSWWDKDRMRCKTGVPASSQVNTVLDQIEERISTVFTIAQIQKKRQPTADDIRAAALGQHGHSVPLSRYAESFIEQLKTRSNRRTGVTIAKVTWQKQLNCLERLREFDAASGYPVMLHTADLNFYHAFTAHLVSLGYGSNTIGKILSIVRSWLREADASGESVNRAYQSTQWYIGRERSNHISLSLEELERIENLKLSGVTEQARDLFLIASFTGLRYSDVSNLSEAVISDGMIHMEQQKTRGEVVVPVHPVVQRLLEKYRTAGRVIPPGISNVIMNVHLKEVARLAGICDEFVKRTTRGGKRISQRMEKWQMVTVHTARRSFAKNLFLTGFKLEHLSRVMGHSSVDQTIEYIGLDAIEKARLLKDHWG
jgi:integrase